MSEITYPSPLIPGGGVKDTDFLHNGWYDETCSRCRKPIPDEEIPLLVWLENRNKMYSYCAECMGWDRQEEDTFYFEPL